MNMENEIKSVVFYRNDFENLSVMDKPDRAEIIESLLSELFLNEDPQLKKHELPVYEMLRDKILRGVRNYQSKKFYSLKRIGGDIYEG